MFHLTFLGASILRYLESRCRNDGEADSTDCGRGGERAVAVKSTQIQCTGLGEPCDSDVISSEHAASQAGGQASADGQSATRCRAGTRLGRGRRFVRTSINNTDWDVPDSYGNLKLVGAGSYGQVCSAINHSTSETIAIKKLYRPLDSKLHSKRAHRELQLLAHLRSDQSNVIRLLDVFTPNQSAETFKDIYLVMEYMPTDLHRIIAAQALEPPAYQLITYQILRGLNFIHSAGVLHRDLKPSNIALNEGLVVKILDFGLARIKSSSDNACMTGYVATRWYRAPEVMLQWEHYGNTGKMDLWSVGCILAEMMTREVLFKGGSEMDQIRLMVDILGIPEKSMMDNLELTARSFFENQAHRDIPPLETRFPGADLAALDLLGSLLKYDPSVRLSAKAALQHHYFQEIFNQEDLMCAPVIKSSRIDELDLSCQQWKGQLYKELLEAQAVLCSDR
ncbi:mitogen-activated protein kinase 14-like [Sycon ciliatum]|uniref:mitogen-activated protein kinase 14-like n=1 Tax=Sycon ciliatum TaxID=27933 RepID=UPI0031F6E58F